MLDAEVEGKIVVVTGGCSGIGRRTVERLSAAGAVAIALDVQPAPEFDSRIVVRQHDVTKEEDWLASMAWVAKTHGRLDALVNCAGIIKLGSIIDMPLDDYRRVMAVNAEGTFLGVKYGLRAMQASGRGSIVNLSSTAGIAGSPGAGAYCASKGAVRLLTKSAALEAIAMPSSIRVNSLHPALTETPMANEIVRLLGGTENIRQQLRTVLPSGRLAKTDDIVDVILFLISDRSSFMNGSEVVVDNGFTAQ